MFMSDPGIGSKDESYARTLTMFSELILSVCDIATELHDMAHPSHPTRHNNYDSLDELDNEETIHDRDF
jgi:hypothetical protein